MLDRCLQLKVGDKDSLGHIQNVKPIIFANNTVVSYTWQHTRKIFGLHFVLLHSSLMTFFILHLHYIQEWEPGLKNE